MHCGDSLLNGQEERVPPLRFAVGVENCGEFGATGPGGLKNPRTLAYLSCRLTRAGAEFCGH